MNHPLASLPGRTRLFQALLVLTLLISIVMGIAGQPLNTPAAPNGIVSFELAGSVTKTQAILDSWDSLARIHAGFIQGLDFLYLCIYSTTVGLGCLLASGILKARRWPLAGVGNPLAWGLWLAALFDAVENTALVISLFGPTQAPWPQIAWVCAVLKFGILFIGLVYVFYGLAVRMVPVPQPK